MVSYERKKNILILLICVFLFPHRSIAELLQLCKDKDNVQYTLKVGGMSPIAVTY